MTEDILTTNERQDELTPSDELTPATLKNVSAVFGNECMRRLSHRERGGRASPS